MDRKSGLRVGHSGACRKARKEAEIADQRSSAKFHCLWNSAPGFTTSERGDAIVMDISLAMTELNRNGHVDRVLITTPQHATMSATQWEEILRRALPPGLLLKTHGAEAQENRRMLEAFRWNLRVLGYIALLVGAFLIYNNL